MAELAFAVFAATQPARRVAEPTLDADATLDPDELLVPARHAPVRGRGRHRDRGRSTIRSYVCVDDVGEVVNPLIVEGQVHGGLAQGIAQALYEEAVHDESGHADHRHRSPTTCCRRQPTAARSTTARTETPATTNPLGVKGVGEAGTIASTPAVVNAVVDALRPLGVSDIEMPCTPYRVWKRNPAKEARS